MTTEPAITGRKPITDERFLRRPDLHEADAEPVLDEDGNAIRDEEGRRLFG